MKRPGEPRGILGPKPDDLAHARLAPAESLDFFVEHYWIVTWDRRTKGPYVQETLPHPSIHLVFERGDREESRVVGVVEGKFTRRLEGRGRVFGVKFRPGSFFPFHRAPISQLTNRVLPAAAIFGDEIPRLERALRAEEKNEALAALADDFLKRRLPETSEAIARVHEIVARIRRFREITKVEQVADYAGLTKRTLQRLFSRYVGVSPKWVIQRYRLHEALEQVDRGETVDWAQTALALGYFDQAHFIKDFKALVGRSPAEYARRSRAAAAVR